MDDDRQRRQTRRQFIATQHPDHGGDPATFAEGLAAFDEAGPAAPDAPPQLVVMADQPWPISLVSRVLQRLSRGRHRPRVG
jgi:hypothetical protein